MSSAARVYSSESGHWYDPKTGAAMHTVIAKGTGKPRPTTLADAKKLGLYPSVSGILKILDKPALNAWKTEQAVMACLTATRGEGEGVDAFVRRVLHEERQHEEEATIARDLGTDIHDALKDLFAGHPIDPSIEPWIRPAFEAVSAYGKTLATEKVLVGGGFGGTTDLVQEGEDCFRLWDWKSTKSIPKNDAWPEHKLQSSAYAHIYFGDASLKPVKTGNIYISTVNCGAFVICEHVDSWIDTFQFGFHPLLVHWQWSKGYWPSRMSKRTVP